MPAASKSGHQSTIQPEKPQKPTGDQRQLCIETGKHFRKNRYDKDVENHQCNTHRDHHEHRVTHRLPDALTHVTFKLQVLIQTQKHFRQATGHLAHPDHGNIESTKHVHMARQRGRKLTPLVQT